MCYKSLLRGVSAAKVLGFQRRCFSVHGVSLSVSIVLIIIGLSRAKLNFRFVKTLISILRRKKITSDLNSLNFLSITILLENMINFYQVNKPDWEKS